MPRLQPFPMRHECVLVQLRPGFDQSVLAARERATNQLNGVNDINTDSVLIVGVEMRSMMWSTGFGIHTNNDPKKACNLWHELMIPQEIGSVYLLILGGLTLRLSCARKPERSGGCRASAAGRCSAKP